MRTLEMNYDRLERLIGPKLFRDGSGTWYLRIENPPYMRLSIHGLPDDRIALAHYSEQNDELMADPEMTVHLIHEMRVAVPESYRNDFVGVMEYTKPKPGFVNVQAQNGQSSFLRRWLINLKQQGFLKGTRTEKNLADNNAACGGTAS